MLLFHSSGIHLLVNSLLNSLVKNFIPISPMHFQTFGNSSGLTALPFFILLSAFFTSLLMQFIFSLTTSAFSVLGFLSFSLFISFSKYSSISLTLSPNLPSHYCFHPSKLSCAVNLFMLCLSA